VSGGRANQNILHLSHFYIFLLSLLNLPLTFLLPPPDQMEGFSPPPPKGPGAGGQRAHMEGFSKVGSVRGKTLSYYRV